MVGAINVEQGDAMEHELDDCVTRYVAVGDVVAGKYLVERTLGSNVRTFVVLARHVDGDDSFALTFLNEHALRDGRVVERFLEEARAASGIRNGHVARVHEVGMHEGKPFVAIEHVRGRDLSAVIREQRRLRTEDAVDYVLQACEGLAAAHAQSVVHRDVKPENLMLVEQEGARTVKLLGCGLTKAPSDAPSYASPEQVRCAASASPQSDVWSLGAVLYELLTGEPAFSGVTVTEVCAAVLEKTPRDVVGVRGDVPRELADVVARSLEKDRERRFTSMAELATALLPFARPDPRLAAETWLRARGGLPSADSGPISSTPTTWTRSDEMPPPPSGYAPEPRVERRGAAQGAAMMLIAAALAVVGVSFGALAPRPEPRAFAATSPVTLPSITPPAVATGMATAAPAVVGGVVVAVHRAAAPKHARAPSAPRPSATPFRRHVDLGY